MQIFSVLVEKWRELFPIVSSRRTDDIGEGYIITVRDRLGQLYPLFVFKGVGERQFVFRYYDEFQIAGPNPRNVARRYAKRLNRNGRYVEKCIQDSIAAAAAAEHGAAPCDMDTHPPELTDFVINEERGLTVPARLLRHDDLIEDLNANPVELSYPQRYRTPDYGVVPQDMATPRSDEVRVDGVPSLPVGKTRAVPGGPITPVTLLPRDFDAESEASPDSAVAFVPDLRRTLPADTAQRLATRSSKRLSLFKDDPKQ